MAADILELVKENGRITTGEIVLAIQAKRATIKIDWSNWSTATCNYLWPDR